MRCFRQSSQGCRPQTSCMYQAPASVAAAIRAASSAAVMAGVNLPDAARAIAELSVVTSASWWPAAGLVRPACLRPSYPCHPNLSRYGTITSVRVDHALAPAIVRPLRQARPRDNANAPVAELVDALDSKSSSARSAGSIPARGTNLAFALMRDVQPPQNQASTAVCLRGRSPRLL